MRYQNLHALIQNSRSSRAYFVSLSPAVQCALHAQNEFVHSAQELRALAAAAQRALSAHGSNAPRLPDGQFVQRHIRFPHCSKCKMLA